MKTEHQRLLLDIARDAIKQRLLTANGREWARMKSPPAEGCPKGGVGFDVPDELLEARATFVTLTLNGNLRGCIGMLEACRPLAEDVAENAVSAAFHDPHFPPLTADEFESLEIHISVLSLHS